MTAQNEERFCRKSSVYNQTGQTYFQQLSAYNHMSAHLRRVLLAPCIVDSRNKRYSRNKRSGSARFSSRSKSLDKIRTQEDIIDGVAYDTRHHPLDVLRKSLECSPECHREVKEVGDACGRCNDWSLGSARSRVGVTSCTIAQRRRVNSEASGTVCQCLHLQPCKPCSTPALKRVSPKSSRLNGGCRRACAPTIADRSAERKIHVREWKRSASDRSRTIKAPPSRNNDKRSERSYAYDSSFESSSENSTAPGSPILKMSEINRGSRPESPADVASRETNNKTSETAERADKAKYAKFIYDITQEITINGLYTDDDLHTIFKKHIDMNSDTLDSNKMQSEIHRLKMALNVRCSSDDEEINDIKRFANTGKFSEFSSEKTQSQDEKSVLFGETRRPKSAHGKNTVVLVDPNPELLITEQDVVLTLREMKLSPRQIQSICKSLQKRSREIDPSSQLPYRLYYHDFSECALCQIDTLYPTLPYLKAALAAFDSSNVLNNSSICIGNIDESPFGQVKNYAETSSFKRAQIRSNSPIDSRNASRTIDVHRSYTDRKLQNASASPRTNQSWQCRCTDSPTVEELQPEVQPEIDIQPSPSHSQGDRIHIAFTNSQMDGSSEPSISTRSARSTESRKIYGAPEENEKQFIEKNISYTSSLGSKKLSQENLRSLVELVSSKSSENKNENHKEEKKGKMEKIHMRRTQIMQSGNKSEDDSSLESTENASDEEEATTPNTKIKTNHSTVKNANRIAHEPKSLPDLKLQSEKASKNNEIENAPVKRNFHNSSPPNEETDIMFVSHSRFLTNLRKGDVSSLPDISERSEGITEEVATDENLKNIHEATADKSNIEKVVTDNKSVNFTEHTSQLDVVSIDNESSEISENIDSIEGPSLTDFGTGKMVEVVMSQTRGIAEPEEDSTDKPSLTHQDSGDEENDEDSDENKRVVVAALKPSSSSGLIPKITFSNPNPAVDKTQEAIGDDKTTLSLDLSPRISEIEDYRSSDDDLSPKNSGKKKQTDDNYSLKIERRISTSNSGNKSSDTSSIETELDQQETFNSTSEMQVEEEKIQQRKRKDEDEESQKLEELAEQSDRDSMKIHEISKSKLVVYRPDKDSSHSERYFDEERSENSKEQKGKQQIRYTRFSRLIGKGNRQRNFGLEALEGTSETTGKKLEISEKDKEERKLNFPAETITTASDISFLRAQNVDDSTQLSIEISSDQIDQQSEPAPSNSREIERYVARSRSLGNSYTSVYSKKESTLGNAKLRPEVTGRRQDVNQSEKSISKRMKAAVGNLMKRSSKCNQSMKANDQYLSRNVSSWTTDRQACGGKCSSRSEVPGAVLSSTLAINSQNSSCVCVLTMEKVQRYRTANCRPDCRGRGFVCDQRCSLFNRILQ